VNSDIKEEVKKSDDLINHRIKTGTLGVVPDGLEKDHETKKLNTIALQAISLN
jgi:hypothetical protein